MSLAVTASGLDSESLDFTLDSIAQFAQRELPDALLIELDERDEFPHELVRRMCSEELGVQLIFVSDEHGGMGGSATDVYRVCERMAGIDLGIATSVLATSLGSDPIRVGATPAQQAHWLGRIASEGILFAYGATEPDAAVGDPLLGAVDPVGDDLAVLELRLRGRLQCAEV